ncbi:hypothetical protein [Desulforegula conservatrix]|uniref:hypothetical protein n=1 Tax=Desulforegula conservatrix TaxID=153026 RepID=UPI000408DAD1|nr:hypothetical protein [Desulforegula conservatrix]
MKNDFMIYTSRAITLIRKNIFTCILPAIFYALFIHNPYIASNQGLFFLMSIILIFFPYPYVYGKIAEIISNCRKSSCIILVKTHWANYLIASLILSTPALLLGLTGESSFIEEAGSFVIDIATLYVFPLVFLQKTSISSILLGIKCLIGNFSYSLPLIIIKGMQSIILSMVQRMMEGQKSLMADVFSSVAGAASIMVSVYIFIVAAMVLKDHLVNLDDECTG